MQEGQIGTLESQIVELKQLMDNQKADFESTKKMQQDRIVKATLLSGLNKAGCIDTDTALMLLGNKVKFDKHGDVENEVDLINELKTSKAHFFTGPATTQTMSTPKAATLHPKDVSGMSDAEFKAHMKTKGVMIR